jgi:hypothetical protein
MLTMRCRECGVEKPQSDFSRDLNRPRGYVVRCKACHNARKRLTRPTNPKRLFLEAKSNAKRRGFEWRLTYEQFLDWIWGAPCYFCGDTSKPNGIDRLNNEPFYDMTNTLPCCGVCNGMKSKLSLHDFLTRVQKIVDRLGRSAQEDVA